MMVDPLLHDKIYAQSFKSFKIYALMMCIIEHNNSIQYEIYYREETLAKSR